jgi:H+-translocating diphosphatase
MKEDMTILTDLDDHSHFKDERKPSGDDWVDQWLLKTYYSLGKDNNKMMRLGICASPLALIFLFATCISNSTPNLIAFIALVSSMIFVGISMWILCWILDKDTGSRAMQDVSDPIKEGSEGFFIT